jgi:hypothetical protein
MNNGRMHNPSSAKQGIEEALNRLNAKMVYAGMEPMELVSCGGASLSRPPGYYRRRAGPVGASDARGVDGKVEAPLAKAVRNLPPSQFVNKHSRRRIACFAGVQEKNASKC